MGPHSLFTHRTLRYLPASTNRRTQPMPDTHRIKSGQQVDIATLPTSGKDIHGDKKAAKAEFHALREEFVGLQKALYAEGKRKLLLVFQAMDAGGKDGTIRAILEGVNPQGVRVESFKAPSKEELAHDFLWRIHKVVPGKGKITVFNRSHYEDVLVVRVDNIVPESVWRPRFRMLNDFEHLLAANGTRILKFFLHISKDEQRRRLQERVDVPEKNWKFSIDDLEKRKQWDTYMAAYKDVLEQCSTEDAPWHVIPSDQNWYRNLTIMRTVVAALKDMNPQYPSLDYDPAGIKVE